MVIYSASDLCPRTTLCGDYFYNYFPHGIDILFDGQIHRIKKFVLHTNFPGHSDFNCGFAVTIDSTTCGFVAVTSKDDLLLQKPFSPQSDPPMLSASSRVVLNSTTALVRMTLTVKVSSPRPQGRQLGHRSSGAPGRCYDRPRGRHPGSGDGEMARAPSVRQSGKVAGAPLIRQYRKAMARADSLGRRQRGRYSMDS